MRILESITGNPVGDDMIHASDARGIDITRETLPDRVEHDEREAGGIEHQRRVAGQGEEHAATRRELKRGRPGRIEHGNRLSESAVVHHEPATRHVAQRAPRPSEITRMLGTPPKLSGGRRESRPQLPNGRQLGARGGREADH